LIGAGTYEEAYDVKIIDLDGKKIAFLACCQYEFGIVDKERGKRGAAWLMDPLVTEKIVEAKKSCDYLFVMPHAGLENCIYPLPEIRELYRHFINLGADGVIASHPHIPQPIEIYKNHPIVYSLGNFCFDKLFDNLVLDYWQKGLCVTLVLGNEEIGVEKNYVSYNEAKKYVEINNNSQDIIHLDNQLNESLKDEQHYLDSINNICLNLQKQYENNLKTSGFFKFNLIAYLMICAKSMIRRKNYSNFSQTSLINSIRCETHRWVLSRIYEINQL